MQPLIVSIVIPTYGRPRQLEGCLEALATQSFSEPWEIVIIDDGSPQPVDLQVVKSKFSGPKAPIVRLIRQTNAGPAAARNHGVACANGTLIAFTDDDCRPESTWLERLVACWQDHPYAMVGGTTVNGLAQNTYSSTSQMIVDLVYDHFNSDADNGYFLTSNNILCTREQFLAIGGFDTSFPRAGAEDRDFCDRWRQQQWPLIWHKEAQIKHYHSQNLRSYIKLHVRYGRGAYIYRKKRKLRQSGSMKEDVNFHMRLFKRMVKSRRSLKSRKAIKLVTNLFIWQLANLAGFVLEASKQKIRSRKGTST